MRHRRDINKLGRKTGHMEAMLAAMVCNLVEEKRVITTLAKAKLARSFAEKMVTIGRKGTLDSRRRLISLLRQESKVNKLLTDVVPPLAGRSGGYTRIVKLGRRGSDSSEMVILEWVGIAVPDKKKQKKPEKEESAKKA